MTKIVVFGGAGFVGSNLAKNLLDDGFEVTVFDSLARRGSEMNLAWLQEMHSHRRFEFIHDDIRDSSAVRSVVRDAGVIYHLAAQVAVTTSVEDPRTDFEVNALGTLNVLEAARLSGRRPSLVFTSTNKVYGGLEDLEIGEMSLFGVFSGPELFYKYPNGDEVYNVTIMYLSRAWQGEIKLNDEHTEWRWFSADEIPEDCSPPIKPILEQFKSSFSK